MLLTAEEYSRGIVKWSADTGATTAVVAEVNGRDVESSRMTDPAGSVPDIDVRGIFRSTCWHMMPGSPSDTGRSRGIVIPGATSNVPAWWSSRRGNADRGPGPWTLRAADIVSPLPSVGGWLGCASR